MRKGEYAGCEKNGWRGGIKIVLANGEHLWHYREFGVQGLASEFKDMKGYDSCIDYMPVYATPYTRQNNR